MAQVERLVVVLEGNVKALRAALAQGNAALAQTELAAGKAQFKVSGITKASKDAAPSIAAFRGSLTALVASTLKLPGPLANVTSLLGTLAFGTATTVGIVAGLAVIAGGYALLTRNTREATKAQEDALDRIRSLGKASREGREGTLQGDIAAQKKELAELEPAYKQALDNRAKLMAAYEGSTTKVDVSAIGKDAIAAYLLAADDLKRAEEELLTIRVEANDAAADKTAEYFKRTRDASKDAHAKALKDLEEHWKRMVEVVGRGARTAMAQANLLATGGRVGPGFMNNQPRPREAGGTGLAAAAAAANARMLANAPSALTMSTVNKFKDAVDGFSDGIKNFFEGFKDFHKIGSQLGASLMQFAAGFLFEEISDLVKGADRWAEAIERNTRALGATGDFLRERLDAALPAGLDPEAVIKAIQEVLNRIAVGDLSGFTFETEAALGAAGIDVEALRKWASSVGFDLTSLQADTLGQFLDAITKAGFGIGGLADAANAATEALRNVPEGFKATLDYLKFRGADAVTAASAGITPSVAGGSMPSGGGVTATRGGTVMNVAAGGIVVNGVQNVKEFLRELEQETLALASRGGAVTFEPAYLRRPR